MFLDYQISELKLYELIFIGQIIALNEVKLKIFAVIQSGGLVIQGDVSTINS